MPGAPVLLFFTGKPHNVIWCAVQNAAQLFQRDKGDVTVLFQSVKGFVVDARFDKAILRYAFLFHRVPQWAVINNNNHHL